MAEGATTVTARRIVDAALLAGTLSGVPSTVHAVATGRDVLASTRAAGTLLGRPTVPRGVVAHAAMTVWWTLVLAAVPRARTGVAAGAAAGVAIGCFDLAVARRWFPRVAALPTGAQLLDHAAFGALVAVGLGALRRRRGARRPRGRCAPPRPS